VQSEDPLREAVSRFGASLRPKFAGIGAVGAPEDQLRGPLDQLMRDAVAVFGWPPNVTLVGESSLRDLKTRPDFAVTKQNLLVGFIEIKAPGKGADPRRFQDPHDKEQWQKLKALPNLLYTDGNSFSLWRDGALQGEIVRLEGSVETAGDALRAPPGLLRTLRYFLDWEPIPPSSAPQLAEISARLCRLLRDEVVEQMELGSPALTGLATDWRRTLFPDASNETFADGYAQAVTFGLLMARAQGIVLAEGLDRVSRVLRHTNLLIGTALRVLTDDVDSEAALKTSLDTLTRVLDVVHWPAISKGSPEAWLYFYELFLSVYDNALRKRTGSYYTPPEIVTAMVRLVDEALRDDRRFGVAQGLASPDVTLADPAMGTGAFLLGVLRHIAERVAADEGEGAVPGVIGAALARLIGFEIQFGPFAVAQLRLTAEVVDLARATFAEPEHMAPRLFLADTLGNPDEEHEYIPQMLSPLAQSRRDANEIKRTEPIFVVIGNPPYKEKARGRGGWVENGTPGASAPLREWMPPKDWGVGAHVKHLRNLYVYFWRWATWKVFGGSVTVPDSGAVTPRRGVICFITVAGFLNGPGFQKMRADLRRDTDEIWIIDCSPEGHQPEVPMRVFQGVQQPVCIVLAVRLDGCDEAAPARVRFRSLPLGRREDKFAAIASVTLDSDGWVECPADWRAPFLPTAAREWGEFPALDDFFVYNGSGVMPGRTWVIAPDSDSLRRRWDRLIHEIDPTRKETLFHPHMPRGELGDRHVAKVPSESLAGYEKRMMSVEADKASAVAPIRYGFRSFDRQWIIPDYRLLNRPNPTLWEAREPDREGHRSRQIYLTAPHDRTPTNGPALTATALIPDLHHYHGRGGRAFPLWANVAATESNLNPALLARLGEAYGRPAAPEDVFAYLAAVAAHPAYTARFAADLIQPGLRIPLTGDPALFAEAATLGREVIWLHTFGERFVDRSAGRRAGPPRMTHSGPRVPAEGAIPSDAEHMPDTISYDGASRRLWIGAGYVDNVPPAVWAYEVSGKQVLTQWFSYRRRHRERPIIGDRRAPSALGDIQPEGWLAEYTTELLNVLNVLARLVALEPAQADLLERICTGATLSRDALGLQ
jgi:hypothetical protein